jgi:hypothetical protein
VRGDVLRRQRAGHGGVEKGAEEGAGVLHGRTS